jgi:hypothetical protein
MSAASAALHARLRKATAKNDVAVMTRALDDGARVSGYRTSHNACLHIAARMIHRDICELLSDRGATHVQSLRGESSLLAYCCEADTWKQQVAVAPWSISIVQQQRRDAYARRHFQVHRGVRVAADSGGCVLR